MAEITVPWPTPGQQLTERQWRDRLTDLAIRAELMIGHPATLQDQARLAVAFCGLLWPALSAELIAGSCRASLVIGPPGVILAATPGDQLVEIAERLDAIWEAARADPSAAVVEVFPPMLELPPTTAEHPSIRRTRAVVEPAAPAAVVEQEPAADADDLPPCWRAQEPAPVALVEQELEQLEQQQEPADTTDWISAADAAELLNISTSTLQRWRLAGDLGDEGADWRQHGRTYQHATARIEAVKSARTARPVAVRRRRPVVADNQPPGWLRPDDVAQMLGVSGDTVRRMIVAGQIPTESIFIAGPRSRWIDPAAVELLTIKKPPGRASQGRPMSTWDETQ